MSYACRRDVSFSRDSSPSNKKVFTCGRPSSGNMAHLSDIEERLFINAGYQIEGRISSFNPEMGLPIFSVGLVTKNENRNIFVPNASDRSKVRLSFLTPVPFSTDSVPEEGMMCCQPQPTLTQASDWCFQYWSL